LTGKFAWTTGDLVKTANCGRAAIPERRAGIWLFTDELGATTSTGWCCDWDSRGATTISSITASAINTALARRWAAHTRSVVVQLTDLLLSRGGTLGATGDNEANEHHQDKRWHESSWWVRWLVGWLGGLLNRGLGREFCAFALFRAAFCQILVHVLLYK